MVSPIFNRVEIYYYVFFPYKFPIQCLKLIVSRHNFCNIAGFWENLLRVVVDLSEILYQQGGLKCAGQLSLPLFLTFCFFSISQISHSNKSQKTFMKK